MTSKNKFGFASIETEAKTPKRDRSPGPMSVAVRDVAENLAETTEAKIEQRRRNAEDAKAFRAAQLDGRVLVSLALADVHTDDLPRDRMQLDAVAKSEEMEELKASIRERGQKEPIEVYVGADGQHQLKKGWRRLTALTQLLSETGDARFATVIARLETGENDRILRYVDMVEENVVREDLTFAEMAQVAITAASDPDVDLSDASELVGRLYSALHKTKKSYIRSFVFLLSSLGDALQWPKEVSRNLGVDVARAIKARGSDKALRKALSACQSPDDQSAVLQAFLEEETASGPKDKKREPKQKFEFFVGKTKVTARHGECRLLSQRDFAGIPQKRLEDAVRAFEIALKEEG